MSALSYITVFVCLSVHIPVSIFVNNNIYQDTIRGYSSVMVPAVNFTVNVL